MLHGAEEGRDAARVVVIGHLCLGICQENGAVQAFKALDETGGSGKGNRQQFRGFIRGIAEHDALVTRTALVNAHRDIRRLLGDDATDLDTVIAKLIDADAAHDLADQFSIFRLVGAGDLPGDDDGVVLDQAFHRDAAVLVMLQAVGDDGIRNLVADFIDMAAGNLL